MHLPLVLHLVVLQLQHGLLLQTEPLVLPNQIIVKAKLLQDVIVRNYGLLALILVVHFGELATFAPFLIHYLVIHADSWPVDIAVFLLVVLSALFSLEVLLDGSTLVLYNVAFLN